MSIFSHVHAHGLNDPAAPEFASYLDESDPLRKCRDEFLIPPHDGKDSIYFCGNSLGLQPKQLRGELDGFLHKWHEQGVEGHMMEPHPWLHIDGPLQEPLAQVVGALPIEVAPMNSLSVNIHVMLAHFYRPTADRFKIIIEDGAFPSDNYVVESQARMHGFDPAVAIIKVAPRPGAHDVQTEDVLKAIQDNKDTLSLVMLAGIQYYTGQFFEMDKITKAGHDAGAMVGWDLAHAVGNVPLRLHDWDVDFACWCSYKYLNSGPGAIGGVFVHERHSTPTSPENQGNPLWWSPRLAGWFGHDLATRFQTHHSYMPVPGAMGFRCSNPSVLDVTALRVSLSIFTKVGMAELRRKSLLITGYLEVLLDTIIGSKIQIITPRDTNHRGAQLSLLLKETSAVPRAGGQSIAREVQGSLAAHGVICDVRDPNVIRIAPAPLYNSYEDVRKFVLILQTILK